jgi:hypothetical protein
MEKQPMRDDQPAPDERQNTNRVDAGKRRRSTRGERAAAQSEQKRADAPAPLSAASQLADSEAGLTDEEIALYRQRVADGVYNSREVAEEVARRMMRRGDI